VGLIVALHGGVATLTIDRPDALNALDWDLLRALEATLGSCATHPRVRCVVLTGAGERAFCGGVDLQTGLEFTADSAREWVRLGHRVCNRLATLPQPVLAAVRGYALGAGLELALACDLRLLGDDAQLGLPVAARGWPPGWGGLRRLQALVGPARARRLALLGEPVRAPEALSWGLAQWVVPAPFLGQEAVGLGQRLAAADPGAMLRMKGALAAPDLVSDAAAVAADEAAHAALAEDAAFKALIAGLR
jgi:enoyl-CoA hydratase/carnithine racemase